MVLMLAVAASAGPVQTKLPLGAWSRVSQDPIISPQGGGFELAGTFNPSVVLSVQSFRSQKDISQSATPGNLHLRNGQNPLRKWSTSGFDDPQVSTIWPQGGPHRGAVG
jgi:hypothetical protein